MRRIVLALALVGGLSPGLTFPELAVAAVQTVKCSSSRCVSNKYVDANSTDTFVGKCTNSSSPGVAKCKGLGLSMSCNNSLGGPKCSCTNHASDTGNAEITLTCP